MTPEKRVFVKKVAHGVKDLMEYLKCGNKIALEPRDDIEKFIKKQIFTQNEFSVGKFRMALDMLNSETLSPILIYFDTIGITIDRAFTMASPNPLLFAKSDMEFAKLINDEDIKTFYDFLIY
jgi:hypothetical protein|tara:strand:+ start:1341 stop:1706 length:366 start_codon:yes stop_codon:yes gene_type:complete